VEQQAARLKKEGHDLEAKGKKLRVKNYEKKMVEK